jgi:hypothetical protein
MSERERDLGPRREREASSLAPATRAGRPALVPADPSEEPA